jgi:recombination protein RecR
MQRVDFPPLIQELIRQLRRMPGIGPRSAERIALWIVQRKDARADEIAEAISNTVAGIRSCVRCGFFAEAEQCVICSDPEREVRRLCVVEQPTDILSLERSGAFRGLYHSLGGRLSPLDHIGPEDLRIDSLLRRVREERPDELIFALSLDVEGEATLSYLADLLKPEGVNLTRIAQGLPAGAGLESADELTLAKAFSGRTAFER